MIRLPDSSLRITGRPPLFRKEREIRAARASYFVVHDSLGWPSHDSDFNKAVNFRVWSQMLRRTVEDDALLERRDWEQLKRHAIYSKLTKNHPAEYESFRKQTRLLESMRRVCPDIVRGIYCSGDGS